MQKSLFYSLVMMITHLIGNLLWIIDVTRDVIFDYGIIKNSEFLNKVEEMEKNNILCTNKTEKNVVLKAEHIYFKYPSQQKWILEDINVEIKEGEKVAIVGEIGSGKSTFIKQLLRLIVPVSGNFYLDNICYQNINTKRFYKDIGFMPQMCVLFNRSILENIKYDNPDVNDRYIIDTIDNFNLRKHFSNLEKGLYSLAGKNGSNLSGGQRQVVWFLKLYFKDPRIIIMDEPTASLDKQTKDLFLDIIKNIFKNKTIIMVTHDNYILKFAERTLTLKEGKLI